VRAEEGVERSGKSQIQAQQVRKPGVEFGGLTYGIVIVRA
jgi:hypothetical protein